MRQSHWSERILYQLDKLERHTPGDFRQPVELYALYESMLGDSRSDVGVQWDDAIQELRRQDIIAVDRAGYVVLTASGRTRVPAAIHYIERRRSA